MKNLATALVKAQKSFGPALKSSTNPHFKSRYFGLSDLLAEIKPVLGRYGLAAFQVPCSNAERVWISTTIIHVSGFRFECGELGVNAAGLNQQNIGSVFTYLKRYALSTVMGVASELEDDDGHQATKTLPTQTVTAKVTPYQQPKPQASGQWWTDLGLTTDEQIKVATDILVNKGWLPDGAPLSALPQAHAIEIATPRMRQAFLEAVKSKLS